MGSTAMRCNIGSHTLWAGFIAMAQKYAWKDIVILYDDSDSYSLSYAKTLRTQLKALNLICTSAVLGKSSDVAGVATTASQNGRSKKILQIVFNRCSICVF